MLQFNTMSGRLVDRSSQSGLMDVGVMVRAADSDCVVLGPGVPGRPVEKSESPVVMLGYPLWHSHSIRFGVFALEYVGHCHSLLQGSLNLRCVGHCSQLRPLGVQSSS